MIASRLDAAVGPIGIAVEHVAECAADNDAMRFRHHLGAVDLPREFTDGEGAMRSGLQQCLDRSLDAPLPLAHKSPPPRHMISHLPRARAAPPRAYTQASPTAPIKINFGTTYAKWSIVAVM